MDTTTAAFAPDPLAAGFETLERLYEELSFAEYKNATQGGVLELDVNPLVLGDLNGDGTISALDLMQLRKVLVDLPVEDLIPAAADLNRNAAIDIVDLVRLRKLLVNS